MSVDDPGTPLHGVTFCVIDLETTGASAATCAITEIGAARFRGGELLGTFQTLVDPGSAVPGEVARLTGLTASMLSTAPTVEGVLPSLLEFVGGAVLVGHNLRFDVSFLDAALAAGGRPPLAHRLVDTVALARRLVRDDDGVHDCRLGTLAARFRLPNTPRHRALDDALATADLFHLLLERAAAFAAHGLDDLLALPRLAGHPRAGKLRLTAGLPRAPGVYVLRDRHGQALRVGKAADLRARVRSYFAARDRRTDALLRDTRAVDHLVCASGIEAAVLEVRLVQALEPRYNRSSGRWRSYRYLAPGRAGAGMVVTRSARLDGVPRLGPFPSTAAARRVAAAIAAAGAEPLLGEPERLLDQLDRGGGPSDSETAAAAAAAVRSLARAITRRRRLDDLRRAGRQVLRLPAGRCIELSGGRFVRAWGPDEPPPPARGSDELARWLDPAATEPQPAEGPIPLRAIDEMSCIAAWINRLGRAGEHRPGAGRAGPVRRAATAAVYAGGPCSPPS